MAINFTNELISDLTLILLPDEEQYIKMSGVDATAIISVQILDVGAKCIIQSCIDSSEYLMLDSTVHADCLWENIKVNSVTLPEVTVDIYSTRFATPNVLYLKNTSLSPNLRVKISLRGNR